MSQKNAKRKRQIQKLLNQAVEIQTLDIAQYKCEKNHLNFDNLSDIEKLQLVLSARKSAIQNTNKYINNYLEKN